MQEKILYLLFSHELTEEQKQDAKEEFGINKVIYLDKKLLDIWTNIPAESKELQSFLTPIKDHFNRLTKDDYVLVQGDFGATYIMVNWIQSIGAIPIYATTERNTVEKMVDGKSIKTSIFSHVRYRIYGE